ncbi:MAG: hypothetical protein HY755_07510 [Nitrospirae bacterium]|nr:hypothetical protein [Nitrospirota bacterium]
MTYISYRSSFSFVVIPVVIIFLLLGVFSLIWLRSNVKAVEYDIGLLSNKRMEVLKERKMLMAEKASILAIQNIKHANDGQLAMVFPDRIKVFYVKKGENSAPYRVSMEERNISNP